MRQVTAIEEILEETQDRKWNARSAKKRLKAGSDRRDTAG